MKTSGKVQKGYGRGGKSLNCPTANIDSEVPEDLKHGIWAAHAQLNDVSYKAVANVGVAPFYKDDDRKPLIEVHLLDYTGEDFYGEELHVELKHWIRGERADFANEEELKECIQDDITKARKLLA